MIGFGLGFFPNGEDVLCSLLSLIYQAPDVKSLRLCLDSQGF